MNGGESKNLWLSEEFILITDHGWACLFGHSFKDFFRDISQPFPVLYSFLLSNFLSSYSSLKRGFVSWAIVFSSPPLQSIASMHLLCFRKPTVSCSLSQTSWQLRLINESQDNWYSWWHRSLIYQQAELLTRPCCWCSCACFSFYFHHTGWM